MIAFILLALALRCWGLGTQSLTMDELVERSIASQSWSEIIHEPNSFPPLYHLILQGWLSVYDGEQSTRWLSLLMGLGGTVALWRWIGEQVGSTEAAAVFAFAAISPFHIFYCQEGRAYMMYWLLATFACWQGWKLAATGSARAWWWFVLVGVVGAYTHYYFAIVLVAIALACVAQFGWPALRSLTVAAVVIGISCLPLLAIVAGDFGFQHSLRSARPLDLISAGYTLFSFCSGYMLGPSRSELHVLSAGESMRRSLPWLVAAGCCFGPAMLLGLRGMWRRGQLRFWLPLLVVPLLLVGALCAAMGLTYNPRFLVWLWMPFAAILAVGWCELPKTWQVAVACGVMTLSSLAIYHRQAVPQYQNEDTRAVAAFLADQADQTVLVCAGYMADSLRFYASHPERIVALRDQGSGGESAAETLAEIAAHRQTPCYLVYTRAFHGDPEATVLRSLTERQRIFQAAGVEVYLLPPTPHRVESRPH